MGGWERGGRIFPCRKLILDELRRTVLSLSRKKIFQEEARGENGLSDRDACDVSPSVNGVLRTNINPTPSLIKEKSGRGGYIEDQTREMAGGPLPTAIP